MWLSSSENAAEFEIALLASLGKVRVSAPDRKRLCFWPGPGQAVEWAAGKGRKGSPSMPERRVTAHPALLRAAIARPFRKAPATAVT